MNRLRFLMGTFLKRQLPVIVVLFFVGFLSGPVRSQQPQGEAGDMQEILHREAVDLLNIGVAQYNRRLYMPAEVTLLHAQEYSEYLTGPEQEQLADYLEKAHQAAIQKNEMLEHVRIAEELLNKGELIRAKAHLKKIRNDKNLAEQEKVLVGRKLEYIDNMLAEQKRQIAELYNRSVDFYNSGQLENARDGFTQIANNGLLVAPKGQTAEDYLMKINEFLSERGKTLPSKKIEPVEQIPGFGVSYFEQKPLDEEIEPEQETSRPLMSLFRKEPEREPAVVVKQRAKEESVIEEVDSRRKSILQSYTKAVMADTLSNVEDYIDRGKFDMAMEAVKMAETTVSENKLYLGDELYKQYSSKLQQLYEQIERSEKSGKRR